jgi:hypothetical protein
MIWIMKHPQATPEMLGFIPSMLSEHDPRPARAQFDSAYGWEPFRGFTMTATGLRYPGDPEMPLLAETKLRDETIRFYECAWVAIVQPDGRYEIARMD